VKITDAKVIVCSPGRNFVRLKVFTHLTHEVFTTTFLATGADPADIDGRFLDLVFEVASGRRTCNELHDQRDIGIFKDGVTL
jgi:altronate dehydratase